jgi:hypothetical protein
MDEEEQLDETQYGLKDPPLRRSTRSQNLVLRLDPKMSSKRHAEVTLPMVHYSDELDLDWDSVVFLCMTQLSMKAGLKRFGQKGEEALSKELTTFISETRLSLSIQCN